MTISHLHHNFGWMSKPLRVLRRHPLTMAALVCFLLLSLSVEPLSGLRPSSGAGQRILQALGLPLTSAQIFLFDSYQRLMPREPQSQPVTIVAIDEASLNAIGQWPWPRDQLAALITQINAQSAAAIGLDIYMPEPDQTSPDRVMARLGKEQQALMTSLGPWPSHDTLLAEALKQAPSVLGAAGFDFEAFTTSEGMRITPIQAQGEPGRFVRRFPRVLASLPELQAAAAGQALLSVAVQEGAVRRIPLVATVGDQLVPGMALEMFRIATGGDPIRVSASARGVHTASVADLVAPTQPQGDIWLHYARLQSGMSRYVSALDVLEGKVDPALLGNKLVVIGLTGAGLSDMRTTALGEFVPGIEIQAQVMEALFDRAFLTRPPWLRTLEWTALALAGLALLIMASRRDGRLSLFIKTRPVQATLAVVAANALLYGLGVVLFHTHGLLLDVATPMVVLSVTMGLLMASSLVEGLSEALSRLSRLVGNGIDMARQKSQHNLMKTTLEGSRELVRCEAVALYLKTEQNTLACALSSRHTGPASREMDLRDGDGRPDQRHTLARVMHTGETVLEENLQAAPRFDFFSQEDQGQRASDGVISSLTVALKPRDGHVIGVIEWVNAIDALSGKVVPFDPKLVSLLEALAAQAAVALENRNLLEAQQALMDAMIKIIAGAIDTKSPYTGGHCERVPELAILLAEKASEVTEGPLAHFAFTTEDEWREFRIGAWLHDCGKVTTPEYVVDKATKLETIFNRIHEIRTRFEVALRDAEIDRMRAIYEQGHEAETAQTMFDARKAALIEDFAFVAECNLGGEFMGPDKVQRLERIAESTWLRHFDDRLGLSHEEQKRYEREPQQALPAIEKLLADKPSHIIDRTRDDVVDEDQDFKLRVPEHLYNLGEIYNLRISRGTLTEEERFKINEHIVQTIVMLESLPLPPNLRRVPEYAGTHHETLIGTGYPRRLTAAELAIPSRIMAIADIFEALTASDRPYKKAKTLSECIKILSFFKKDKHIDPDLFDLFLTSGVYKTYAQRYLSAEQIDEVDIAQYVG